MPKSMQQANSDTANAALEEFDTLDIVAVEDSEVDYLLIEHLLTGSHAKLPVKIERVESVAALHIRLHQKFPDVLLLDLSLPGDYGTEKVQDISERYPSLPIIVLTGIDDIETSREALEKGAQEYLCKEEITASLLTRAITYAVDRKHTEAVLQQALITSAAEQNRLKELSSRDGLTGLANRDYIFQATVEAVNSSKRDETDVAIVNIDLNRFKEINDIYGHDVGDEILIQVSKRLLGSVREKDIVARMGGDEFVILVAGISDKNDILPLLFRIKQKSKDPILLEHQSLVISLSVGIAFYSESESIQRMFKQADIAMYASKRGSSESAYFFSDATNASYQRYSNLSACAEEALKKDEFTSRFQPVLAIADQTSTEVLLATYWHSPEYGVITSKEFAPIFNSQQLYLSLINIQLKDIAEFCKRCAEESVPLGRVHLHLHYRQVLTSGYADQFLANLKEQGIQPELLSVSFTQTLPVDALSIAITNLTKLRDAGINIVLSSYGVGLSSVESLLKLPITAIRLHPSLSYQLEKNQQNRLAIESILLLAHKLGIETICQDVNSVKDAEILHEIGVSQMSGTAISKPLNLKKALRYLPGKH